MVAPGTSASTAVRCPAPWLLAALLAAILSVLGVVAIGELLRAGAWAELEPDAGAEREGA